MSLKRTFIQMSITKQIYFGLFGMAILTCANVFILIFITSFILSNIIYRSVNIALEKLDNNMMSLYAQFADVTGSLFLEQGKLEIVMLRYFFENLKKDKNNFISQLVPDDDIKKYFKENSDSSSDCKSDCPNSFYFQSFSDDFSEEDKKLFIIMIPVLETMMKVKPYDNESGNLFQEIYFTLNDKQVFISYPYDTKKINELAKDYTKAQFDKLVDSTISKYKEEVYPLKLKLNKISEDSCTYQKFTLENPGTVASFTRHNYLVTPFFNETNPWAETGSFAFKEEGFNCTELSSFDNLIDYIGGKWDYNVINKLSISLTNRTDSLYAMLVSDTEEMYSMSWEVCNIIFRLGMFYNDTYKGDSDKNMKSFSEQNPSIWDCFGGNEKAIELIKKNFPYESNKNSNAKSITKRMEIQFAKYSYTKDTNNKVLAKVFQYYSPANYVRTIINSPFFSTFSFYFFIIKIQNGFRIEESSIYYLFLNLIFFIILISLATWVLVFFLLWTRVCVVAHSISSPISKLIANISSEQDSNDETSPLNSTALTVRNNTNVSNISYKDDKDIDDLFKICQVLIVGGFKGKEPFKRNNSVNVYNNVAIVKTNNLMINEYEIESQKDEVYHTIFKDEEVQSKGSHFEKEVYRKHENEEFKNEMNEFIQKRYEKLDQKGKNEIKKSKIGDYKFLRMINKDLEEVLPSNILYKLYSDEIIKKEKSKSNVKKR